MTTARRLTLAVLAVFGLLSPLAACPFCTQELGRTMIDDYGKASMVIAGTFSNPRLGAGFEEGQTDFTIDNVLKSHDILVDKGGFKKTVAIPKYVNQPGTKFVLFCDVYKGRIDAYRAVPVESGSELVQYVTGAVKKKETSLTDRLQYCFPYLNSKEFEVSLDAYREFANADYKDYRDMASKLDPKVLVGWLGDPKTPAYRFGLYASLLGHCGKADLGHGAFLRKLILDSDRHKGSGLDGMLVGYVMIEPKEGWAFVQDLISTPDRDFNTRYACLRAVRFLWSQRPDLVTKADRVKAVVAATRTPDLADFAIDDLRKWRCWEATKDVMGLVGQKSHDVGVIQRAILRFALQSPEAEAAAYVRQQRKRDPEQVRDTEEILKLETDTGTNGR
jgi:hypothetical protein